MSCFCVCLWLGLYALSKVEGLALLHSIGSMGMQRTFYFILASHIYIVAIYFQIIDGHCTLLVGYLLE